MNPLRIAVGLIVLGSASLLAAPVPKDTDEPVVDRKKYLPNRAYQPRPGKVIGVAVSDVVGMMGREGRSSQADALGFSSDGGSYNWMYVPMDDMPQITNLNVRVGPKGEETLVEVEVNNGKGAPADEAFVASKMRVVDGSKAFPINVDDCVAKAKALYAGYRKENAKKFEEAMAKAGKDALAEKKATGPREAAELMHVTWLTKENRLVVTFQTTLTDGAYQIGGGGANLDGVDPVPEAVPVKAVAKRPPPPRDLPGVRWGTQFGIEFGRSYEFNIDGAALGTKTLAAERFKKELPPPPAGIGRLFELPPPPLPVAPPKKGK